MTMISIEFRSVPPSDLLLRLGEYDLAEEEEPYLYQERRVQIVASHPQFDPRTFEYDLALLRFYEPVVFQPNIIPVCVPESDENFIGRTAFVTGWGRLYEGNVRTSIFIVQFNGHWSCARGISVEPFNANSHKTNRRQRTANVINTV